VCDKAYANVDKSFMGANTSFSVTRWYSQANNQPVDILTLFSSPGNYTVVVAVDAYAQEGAALFPKGYVDEGNNGGENNNVSQPVTFTVKKVGHITFLPNMRK